MTMKYVSESVVDVLGYEPHELIGTSSLDLLHPDELQQVQRLHLSTIKHDKAAVLVYAHIRHKDPARGYFLVSVGRTVAEDVVVGSITLAVPGPGAMHSAATATEVIVVSPEAQEFKFYKWNDPDPMEAEPLAKPPQPANSSALRASSTSNTSAILNTPDSEETHSKQPSSVPVPLSEPAQEEPLDMTPVRLSPRLAIVLDRFSRSLPIIYMSNTRLLPPTAEGRSFFDFVRMRDERLVRAWLEAIKGWDAGAGGLGEGGGFGYGRFGLVLDGRNSRRKASGSRQSGRQRRCETDENVAVDAGQSNLGEVGRAQRTTTTRAQREWRTASVGGQYRTDPDPDVIIVDGIFSAHSDGLLVILRRSEYA